MSTASSSAPQYLTEREVAQLSTIPVATLRTRRCRNPELGPPYRKIGRRVIYRLTDPIQVAPIAEVKTMIVFRVPKEKRGDGNRGRNDRHRQDPFVEPHPVSTRELHACNWWIEHLASPPKIAAQT